jgi:hypothetical protein
MENIPLLRPVGGQQWREEDDPVGWVADGENTPRWAANGSSARAVSGNVSTGAQLEHFV